MEKIFEEIGLFFEEYEPDFEINFDRLLEGKIAQLINSVYEYRISLGVAERKDRNETYFEMCNRIWKEGWDPKIKKLNEIDPLLIPAIPKAKFREIFELFQSHDYSPPIDAGKYINVFKELDLHLSSLLLAYWVIYKNKRKGYPFTVVNRLDVVAMKLLPAAAVAAVAAPSSPHVKQTDGRIKAGRALSGRHHTDPLWEPFKKTVNRHKMEILDMDQEAERVRFIKRRLHLDMEFENRVLNKKSNKTYGRWLKEILDSPIALR